MKPCELQPILARAVEGIGIVQNGYWNIPPEARVITGNPKYDAQLHYVLVEFGVEVKLDLDNNMEDYRVVDEKKFTMFLLRWS
jgi:hypothetical protein